jgi:hypothetical protein
MIQNSDANWMYHTPSPPAREPTVAALSPPASPRAHPAPPRDPNPRAAPRSHLHRRALSSPGEIWPTPPRHPLTGLACRARRSWLLWALAGAAQNRGQLHTWKEEEKK